MDLWMNLSSLSVFTTSTLLIGTMTGVGLLLNKRPTGRWLGFLIISYLILLVTVTGGFANYTIAAFAQLSIAIYVYLRSFFYQKNRISPIHFIVLLFGWLLPFVLDESIGQFIIGAVATAYAILCIRLLLSESQARGFSYLLNPGSRIVWLRNFVGFQTITLIAFLFPLEEWVYSMLIVWLITYILHQLFQESSFLSPIPIGNKYKKSTLAPGIKAAMVEKLEDIMLVQKFYRNDDASLTKLADKLGVTNHHLSQVLNDSLKISFQDLIARYRIREACQLLRDESNEQVKIENIATQVGYNSKSAFNTAFKRRTGQTPSEYRDSKDVLIYGEERLSERKEPQNAASRFDLNHVFNLKIRSGMIQHFFKIFSRNVKRNGLFSFLNVLGLTVGFTCSILIYLFIQDELSYDKSLPNADRMYRIAWMSDNPQTRTPHPMAQTMVSDLPEVEEAVSISPWYGPGLSRDKIRVKNIRTNVVFEEPDFFFADSTFFDIFQLKVLEGDPEALSKPFSLVITEPMARKYFGDSTAVGQELSLNDMELAVSAVVEPMPEHAHFHFNALIPYVTLKQINPTSNWMKWADFGHFNYIRLKEGANADEVEAKIPGWVVNYLDWDQSAKDRLMESEGGFKLQAVTDIHLHSHVRWELEDNGNILYIYILGAILAFILLIAAINYINLTTAKSIERAKEVGVRKTLGAITRNLSGQFYLESILFSMAALLVSFGLAALLLNGFNNISGKHFEAAQLLEWSFLSKSLLIGLGIGVLAGFYPAIALSSFKPTEVLKGKLTTTSKGVRLRSALVILQFSISAILISGSFIIFNQIRFMKDMDLGFDQEAVISLNVPISIAKGNIDLEALRTTQHLLKQINGVRSTTMTSSVPGGQFNQHPYFLRDIPEERVDVSELMVDYGVDEVLGLEMVEGRMFDKSYASDSVYGVIINETFAKQLNAYNLLGMTLVQDASGREYESTIVGIIKDFHFQSLHQEIQPLMMSLQPLGAGNMLVKLDGQNFGETIKKIEEVYMANIETELPFEYNFLDQDLEELYHQEEQTLSIFSIFSLIALILASLGLLGMAIAILNQRIKEVGMRKILGATTGQIMLMVLGQFARLVVIALIIGLPLSYLLMEAWITEFSYRAPVGIVPFIGAIFVLLVVATLSVVSAVSKIAFANPVDTLRYE